MRNVTRNQKSITGVTTVFPNPRAARSWSRTTSRRSLLALLLALMVVSSNSLVRVRAAAGDLDPAFDTDGKVVMTGFPVEGGFDGATAVAIQADSKIVVVGTATDTNFNQIVLLIRYNANGSLDPTFGIGGKVTVDFQNGAFSSNDLLRFDVAIQGDGKIVIAGTADAGNLTTDIGVARYDTSGNPDPTFGIGGKVTTDFFGNNDAANSLAIQSDGKIVVAGSTIASNFDTDFALVRYESDGDLDGTFGIGGKVTTDFFGLIDFGSD